MNLNWRIGLYCLLGGLCFTLPALGTGHFGWLWLSGIMTVASLVPVVRFGPRNPLALFGAIALAMVVVGLACTLTEGALFFPQLKSDLMRDLTGGTVLYLVVAAVLVGLSKLWRLPETSAYAVEDRRVRIAIPLVLVAGLSYVASYLIFGTIAFQFFTKQYYPHAQEQALALGIWFWAYQWMRGLLMTLAVLPIIYTLRLRRWQAAIVVGGLLWVVGGCAPLLVPNPIMMAAQRYIHIAEIFTQNFLLGVTAVLLLRPRTARLPESVQTATSAL
jgi:hypothetical protein